jgi:ribosomal protein S18 acetylase RimI-like enzyme
MHIRRLTSEDGSALLSFYLNLSEEIVKVYHPFKFTGEVIGTHLSGADCGEIICLGLIGDDGAVDGHGFIRGVGGERPVFGIGLSDRAIGQGWGRKLMQAVMDEADAAKLPLVYLTVYKINERAVSLYEKMGFVLTGETDFRGPADSWCMERRRAW